MSHVEAKCKRCRHKWEELTLLGTLLFCPRCFASKISRKILKLNRIKDGP